MSIIWGLFLILVATFIFFSSSSNPGLAWTDTSQPSARISSCGDAIVDWPDEECDMGTANGTDGCACGSDCRYSATTESSGAITVTP